MSRLTEAEIQEAANKYMQYEGLSLELTVEHIAALAGKGQNYEHLIYKWFTPEGNLYATMNDTFIKDVSYIPLLAVEPEFQNQGFYTWMCGSHTRFVRALGLKRVDIAVPETTSVYQMHVDAGFIKRPNNHFNLYVDVTEETTPVEKYSSDKIKEKNK